jgi:hypothetical protein
MDIHALLTLADVTEDAIGDNLQMLGGGTYKQAARTHMKNHRDPARPL